MTGAGARTLAGVNAAPAHPGAAKAHAGAREVGA